MQFIDPLHRFHRFLRRGGGDRQHNHLQAYQHRTVQRHPTVIAAARHLNHHLRLLAKAGIHRLGQQNRRYSQSPGLAQGRHPLPVRRLLPHHNQHVAALQAYQLLGEAKPGAVHHVRRQTDAAQQPGGIFRQNARGADPENPHLAGVGQQRHRLGHRRTVGGARQHFAGPLMPVQHEIDARIDVAGQGAHRGDHFFRRGRRRAEPALHGLLQLPQAGEAERLDGAHHRGVRGIRRGGDFHSRALQHRFPVFVDIAHHRQQTRRQLMRASAKTLTEQVHPSLLSFNHRFHCNPSGKGRPAMCDCTWATISDSAA